MRFGGFPMSRIKYQNSPIVEAVCGINFNRNVPWDITIPGVFSEKIKDTFPKKDQIKDYQASIEIGPDGGQQRLFSNDRMRFLTDDETSLIQISTHYLSISKLKPYSSWEEFLHIIDQQLLIYREVAQPSGIERIGLRYINEFVFSERTLELEDYFDFYPYVSKNLPQNYNSFVTGVEFAYDDETNILRLQMTNKGPNIILDLDYFLGKPGEVNFDNVHQWLELAHKRVQSVFEGSLKDRERDILGR